jgi:exopolysaccharide biosynthesis polyprenyl glycosylphosphotransferase
MSEQTLRDDAPIVPVPVPAAPVAEGAVVDEAATTLLDVVADPRHPLRATRGEDFRRRQSVMMRALAGADVLALAFAFLIAELLTVDAARPGALDGRTEFFLFVLTLPVWLVAARLYGLYGRDERRWDHSTFDELVPILHLTTVGTWGLFAAAWALGYDVPAVSRFVIFWALGIVLVVGARIAARFFCRRSPLYVQNAVIVGAGDVGQLLARKLLQHPEYGVNIVGFVDEAPKERRDDLGWLTLLGGPGRLPQIVRQFDVERVIVAFSNESHESTLDLIRSLRDLNVRVDLVPRLFEILGPDVALHGIGGLPLVSLPNLELSRAHRTLKRAIDVVLAGLGMIALTPAFLAFALLIKRSSPGPIFFRQVRMGAGDRTFKMFKFRTMTHDADLRKDEFAHLNKHLETGGDPRMFKIPDDPRVTSIGRFLRRYSLDELPQLINVLRGEMTLVGPRPLILDEDRHITEWGRRRLDLKPGMTGTWQVLGRSDIPFAEMVKLDYLYVTNWSPWRDLKLIFQTFPAILRSRSIVY